MGGKGSGNWLGSARKTSVTECVRLTVKDLRESGVIAGQADDVVFSWASSESKGDVASVRARVTSRTTAEIVLRLTYAVVQDGEPHEVNETVHVVNAGEAGRGRWWFKCPAQVDGEPCSRRAAILYLPPGQEYFACRHCHELSYPEKSRKKAEGDQQDDVGDTVGDDVAREAWDQPWTPEQDVADSSGEPATAPPPLRSFFYIDHALKQLDQETTTLKDRGRAKLVDQLLSKMIRDDGLPTERFSQVISEVQSLAPKAFAAFAAQALRDGSFAVGSVEMESYAPLHRLGHVLRLHLIDDLQAERAADLLLVDAAIAAFVQTRILLTRATPMSENNGPLPGEEKLYRSQATAQQKLFMTALDKLRPKPARPRGRPRAKESA